MTQQAHDAEASEWPFWKRYLNLAQPRLGARVVCCNDEFFGAAERLIDPASPVFVPDKYDDHGKWMDGWETRRRRKPGHDWCALSLGAPAVLFGVDIDTSHFNGNQPQAATVYAARTLGENPPAAEDPESWFELVKRTELAPSSQHRVALDPENTRQAVRHLRLDIFPDGGVARLRVYGQVCAPVAEEGTAVPKPVDLGAALSGGSIVAASDEHFGAAANLLLPGRGIHMGDGWETARRRGPGYDWAIVRLGQRGLVSGALVDTAHFKGNYPHECSLQYFDGELDSSLTRSELGDISQHWPTLHPRVRLDADAEAELSFEPRHATHVRVNMYPDGGISRLRVWGTAVGSSGE